MSAQTLEPLPRVNGRHRDRALASARKQRAIDLKMRGLSYQAIADQLGYTSRGTVYKILRRTVRVERQRLQDGSIAPTKTPKLVRTVPLGEVVVDELAAHLAGYPSGEWLFTTPTRGATELPLLEERLAPGRRQVG